MSIAQVCTDVRTFSALITSSNEQVTAALTSVCRGITDIKEDASHATSLVLRQVSAVDEVQWKIHQEIGNINKAFETKFKNLTEGFLSLSHAMDFIVSQQNQAFEMMHGIAGRLEALLRGDEAIKLTVSEPTIEAPGPPTPTPLPEVVEGGFAVEFVPLTSTPEPAVVEETPAVKPEVVDETPLPEVVTGGSAVEFVEPSAGSSSAAPPRVDAKRRQKKFVRIAK